MLVEAPSPGMPWPKGLERLAHPRAVRPPADMWLVSASMGVMDGTCSSPVLAAGLGWSQPIRWVARPAVQHRLGTVLLLRPLLPLLVPARAEPWWRPGLDHTLAWPGK